MATVWMPMAKQTRQRQPVCHGTGPAGESRATKRLNTCSHRKMVTASENITKAMGCDQVLRDTTPRANDLVENGSSKFTRTHTKCGDQHAGGQHLSLRRTITHTQCGDHHAGGLRAFLRKHRTRYPIATWTTDLICLLLPSA